MGSTNIAILPILREDRTWSLGGAGAWSVRGSCRCQERASHRPLTSEPSVCFSPSSGRKMAVYLALTELDEWMEEMKGRPNQAGIRMMAHEQKVFSAIQEIALDVGWVLLRQRLKMTEVWVSFREGEWCVEIAGDSDEMGIDERGCPTGTRFHDYYRGDNREKVMEFALECLKDGVNMEAVSLALV
jgi:hypothetical protein